MARREKIKHDALINELLKDVHEGKDILWQNGLLKQLTKRLIERALQGELAGHPGYAPYAPEGEVDNCHKGKATRMLQTESSASQIEVPRDRDSTFDPKLVRKRQRTLESFDHQVLALYTRGLNPPDIQDPGEKLYEVEVSSAPISNDTDVVMDEVRAWRSRPLSAVYPIVYFDFLFVKTRQNGPVTTKAVYLALGINLEGERELLGLWVDQSGGAKFWLSVFNELKNRGVQDCFIACMDGLKGLPEAVEAVFPLTQVRLEIVHKVRSSLKYVPWKERKAVAQDLRTVYAANSLAEAEHALERFSATWDAKYPAISHSWRAEWQRLAAFFNYSPEIRRLICTTATVESLNCSLRRLLKMGGPFPDDDSIIKALYLSITWTVKKWKMPIRDWKSVLNQFIILFGDRVPV